VPNFRGWGLYARWKQRASDGEALDILDRHKLQWSVIEIWQIDFGEFD
jgi:hypothetical protein